MPAEIRCKCGKKLKGRDGEAIACPVCGSLVEGGRAKRPRSEAAVRLWLPPSSLTENLIVMDSHAVYIAMLDEELLSDCATAIEEGADPREVLEGHAKPLMLDDLDVADWDLGSAYLILRPKKASHWFLNLPSTDMRDEIIDALKERLGPGWRDSEGAPPPLWVPIIVPVVLLALTAGLAGLFAWMDRFSPVWGTVTILAVAGCCIAWIVNGTLNPPRLVTLERVRR